MASSQHQYQSLPNANDNNKNDKKKPQKNDDWVVIFWDENSPAKLGWLSWTLLAIFIVCLIVFVTMMFRNGGNNNRLVAVPSDGSFEEIS